MVENQVFGRAVGGVKRNVKFRIRAWSGDRQLWFFFGVRNVEYRNKCKEEGKI